MKLGVACLSLPLVVWHSIMHLASQIPFISITGGAPKCSKCSGQISRSNLIDCWKCALYLGRHHIYGLNIFLSNHPPCFRRWPGRPPPLRTRKTWEKETFSSSRSPLSTKTTTKIFITSTIIIIILIHRGTEHHHHQEDPLSTSDLRENQLQGRLSPPPLTSPSQFVVDDGDDEYDVVVDNGDDGDKDDGDDDGDEEEMIAVTICRW